jgi:hypothetical protein
MFLLMHTYSKKHFSRVHDFFLIKKAAYITSEQILLIL